MGLPHSPESLFLYTVHTVLLQPGGTCRGLSASPWPTLPDHSRPGTSPHVAETDTLASSLAIPSSKLQGTKDQASAKQHQKGPSPHLPRHHDSLYRKNNIYLQYKQTPVAGSGVIYVHVSVYICRVTNLPSFGHKAKLATLGTPSLTQI